MDAAQHRTASIVTSLLSRQPTEWHLLIEPHWPHFDQKYATGRVGRRHRQILSSNEVVRLSRHRRTNHNSLPTPLFTYGVEGIPPGVGSVAPKLWPHNIDVDAGVAEIFSAHACLFRRHH